MEEKIPLQEAVQRGLIPCAACGATGAQVRKVAGKDHFLCPACHRKNRGWVWLLAGLAVAILGLGGYLLRGRRPDGPPSGLPPPSERGDSWMKETSELMRMHRYAEARARIQSMLEPLPRNAVLNFRMGQCLMALKATEAAVPHLKICLENEPELKDEAAVWLGLALNDIGRAAEALPHLEKPCGVPDLDDIRKRSLAKCYLELERYEDALKLVPAGTEDHWTRFRALVHQGKSDEARRYLETLDEKQAAAPRISHLREEGDFAGARAAVDSALARAETHVAARQRLQRSDLVVSMEGGDLARLEATAAELVSSSDPAIRGEALAMRAIGQLLTGRRDAARASAWEFLNRTDAEYSPLRFQRMMMRHLVGDLTDKDVEAEAKLVSRFHSNDLYWYLAVATGDRAWAEKALQATPGRNYPYHSIRRILGK